jgi:hypothetical protein
MDSLDLLYGDGLKVFENLEIKHPTLLTIKQMGYQKYAKYISCMCINPIDIADILWIELDLWFEDFTAWSLFVNTYMNDETTREALDWFTGGKFELVEDDIPYFIDKSNNIKIDETIFNYIVNFIREINFISIKQQYNAANRMTHERIFKEKYRKRKKKGTAKIDLASITSSLMFVGKVGNEVWDYPIYKVYEGYFRLCNVDNYDKTMTAIYNGNVDGSKIDLEKINWANIITV